MTSVTISEPYQARDVNQGSGRAITWDRAGRTGITLRALLNSKAQRDYLAEHYRAVEGARETLARLEAYVHELGSVGS